MDSLPEMEINIGRMLAAKYPRSDCNNQTTQ